MRANSGTAAVSRHVAGVGLQALLIVGIVAALVLAAALFIGHPVGADSVLAAKGGNGNNASRAGASCAVTPNDVALGDQYRAVATGLPSGTQVLVEVSGAGGANFFVRSTSDSGEAVVEWYATWRGSNTVGFYTSDGRMRLYGDCTFNVS